MSYFEARVLDRLNGGVVRLRVGARQPVPDPARLDRYVSSLPDDPFEPAVVEGLEPAAESTGRVQQWRARDSDWVATRIVPRHGGPPRAALVFLHGWLATPGHVHLMRLASTPLLSAGIEIWIPRLPAHIERTPSGAVSGERCLSADLVATGEALRLAVAETRALGRWLRRQGRSRIGLWGISLGGWVAALTASSAGPWDAAALWTPVADPVPTLWTSPLADPIRKALQQGGVERRAAERMFAPFAPVGRKLRSPSDAVLMLGARYDNVVPPASLEALSEQWGSPCDWFEHGHISILWSRRAKRTCRSFLRDRLGR